MKYIGKIPKNYSKWNLFFGIWQIITWANINTDNPQDYFDPNVPHYYLLSEDKEKLIHIQNNERKTTFYTHFTYFKPMYLCLKIPSEV